METPKKRGYLTGIAVCHKRLRYKRLQRIVGARPPTVSSSHMFQARIGPLATRRCRSGIGGRACGRFYDLLRVVRPLLLVGIRKLRRRRLRRLGPRRLRPESVIGNPLVDRTSVDGSRSPTLLGRPLGRPPSPRRSSPLTRSPANLPRRPSPFPPRLSPGASRTRASHSFIAIGVIGPGPDPRAAEPLAVRSRLPRP